MKGVSSNLIVISAKTGTLNPTTCNGFQYFSVLFPRDNKNRVPSTSPTHRLDIGEDKVDAAMTGEV